VSAPSKHLPKQLGRYEIVGLLATGGMAEVFLARHMGPSGFERVAVVKRIFPHLAREPALVSMFLDEGRIAARIHHPNVVQVTDLGRDGDELFLAMELVEGESLGSFMRRHWSLDRPIGYELAAYIVAEACAGLHAAHELLADDGTSAEIVHRDVSPQNIMMTYGGHVKVVDFGIAKAADRVTKTQTGELKGKVEYMSPEQARSEVLDRRTDLFSLGVLLFEMILGKRLFRRAGELASLRAVTEDPIPLLRSVDPHAPAALEVITAKALARRREDRYPTAEAMRRDLVQYLRGSPNVGVHGDLLSSRMRELFADRLERKAELLRSVRTGSASGSPEIPASEVDLGVDQPVVATLTPSTRAASHSGGTVVPRSRAPLFVVAGVVAVAAGAVAGALTLARAPAVGESVREAPSSTSSTSSAPEVASAQPPLVEPATLASGSTSTALSSTPLVSSASATASDRRVVAPPIRKAPTATSTAASPYRRFN
jgi:serine/threonine-protein kinase